MKSPGVSKSRSDVTGNPPILWIMLGFGAAYLCFFIVPIFFSGPKMDVLVRIVPVMVPIGADLRQTLLSVERVLLEGATPYVGDILYPPLAYVLHGPLLWMPRAAGFALISALTLASFCWIAVGFPLRAAPGRGFSVELLLVFLTGLMSYGLLFELERGQFNVIAAALAYAGISQAHAEGSRRWLWSGALLGLAAQLKLSPVLFFPAMVRDWRDWRQVLRLAAGLTVTNLALLLVLGPRILLDFVNAAGPYLSQARKIRIDNHSIYSFTGRVGQSVQARGFVWTEPQAVVLEVALLAIVVLAGLSLIFQAYRTRFKGFNPDLLLACALAAAVIPRVSHDYTLPILAGPVAIYLAEVGRRRILPESPLLGAAVLVLFSFAYASLLFPLGYKPGVLLLQNNLPALLALLVLTTFISWRSPRQPEAG